jgi:polyisoprenoid-binding protein YceI
MFNFKSVALAAVITTGLAGTVAGVGITSAEKSSWVLDPTVSSVSFGSIKNDYIGESHTFGEMSGTVSADGEVTIELGLGSVETMIEKRNERIINHVFANAPSAVITAKLDMDQLANLALGASHILTTSGNLSFLGQDNEIEASFFVIRLSDDKVMVTTNGMIMLSTTDVGIDVGIDKLQELAGLDSITRVSPVTMRLIFDAES